MLGHSSRVRRAAPSRQTQSVKPVVARRGACCQDATLTMPVVPKVRDDDRRAQLRRHPAAALVLRRDEDVVGAARAVPPRVRVAEVGDDGREEGLRLPEVAAALHLDGPNTQ